MEIEDPAPRCVRWCCGKVDKARYQITRIVYPRLVQNAGGEWVCPSCAASYGKDGVKRRTRRAVSRVPA